MEDKVLEGVGGTRGGRNKGWVRGREGWSVGGGEGVGVRKAGKVAKGERGRKD